MKKNKIFFKSLSHDWYKYTIVLIPLVGVLTISSIKTRITYEEQIRIFNYINPTNTDFENELKNQFKDQGVLDCYVQPYTVQMDEFYQYLDVTGFSYSDIIILSESIVLKDTNYISSNTYHFGKSFEDEYISLIYQKNPNVELMNYNDSPFGFFGIKIFIKDNSEYNSNIKFNNYYTFEEDTIVFISKKSNKINNKIAINSLLYLL